jgi:ABC-type dipeptide/oligopeptide/nickel transport system ATPase component
MIFRPDDSMNPVFRPWQVAEPLLLHQVYPVRRWLARSLLGKVGTPAAASRAQDYPHQFSGGMRQRAMMRWVGRPLPRC